MNPASLPEEQRARLATRSTPRHSDFAEVALPPLPAVRGMVSESECRYLYWLTSRGYTGAGAVVEVGTWLGRSTLHLAAGLRDAGFPAALHCYDQFVWHRSYGRDADLPLRRGDDFQPFFEATVRPVYPGLVVGRAGLHEIAWSRGPIEILFLDAPKHLVDLSWALAALAPYLVPGLSLLILQDYLHPPAYALPAVIASIGDALAPLHVVEGGSTVAFRVDRPLDFGRAQPLSWNYTRWSPEFVVEAIHRSAATFPPAARARLRLSAALLLHRRGEMRWARQVVADLAADPALRPYLERDAAALLYADYPTLFRAARIAPPAPGNRRGRGVRFAIRRTRASARRWLRLENLTETIG